MVVSSDFRHLSRDSQTTSVTSLAGYANNFTSVSTVTSSLNWVKVISIFHAIAIFFMLFTMKYQPPSSITSGRGQNSWSGVNFLECGVYFEGREEGWWCFLTEADGEVADRTKWLCAEEVSFVSKHQTSLKSKHLSLHAHNFPRVYAHSRGHALIDERTRETLRKKVWNYLNVWLAMEEQTLVSFIAGGRLRLLALPP